MRPHKLIAVITCLVILGCASLPLVAWGEDAEVLTLKRDLLAERIVRLQTTLQLMQRDFAAIQAEIPKLKAEMDALTAKLKAMEPAPKEKK